MNSEKIHSEIVAETFWLLYSTILQIEPPWGLQDYKQVCKVKLINPDPQKHKAGSTRHLQLPLLNSNISSCKTRLETQSMHQYQQGEPTVRLKHFGKMQTWSFL